MDKSREQFEVVYEQMKNDRFGTNEEWAWKFWQASRAAVEIELPPTIEVHPLGPSTAKMFCELHKNTVAECANSIRAAGLKVKGD
ncbi:hypothetical protein [Cronobacter sakazakii]|uniref:hypothetical protein n=1 Tax=Cronobacter sakazakii TaxID=28141 RepID=UPI00057734AC|nr:hypothetical protein [Cronobacter sakazakii]PUV56468.1 hypothetical protein CDT88_04525 [Cronobacter sakazakii]